MRGLNGDSTSRSVPESLLPPDPEEKCGKVLEIAEDLLKRSNTCKGLEDKRVEVGPMEERGTELIPTHQSSTTAAYAKISARTALRVYRVTFRWTEAARLARERSP